jgi:tetratricopeptide (TPR) repeat protein
MTSPAGNASGRRPFPSRNAWTARALTCNGTRCWSFAQKVEAAHLFDQGQNAFRADRFEEAEDLSTRCLALDPTHKEAGYLQKLARLEPKYREGQRAIDLGLWRDAYKRFKWVTDRDATYKGSWDLQTRCQEEASYTLAYVPLYNRAMHTGELGEVFGHSPVEAQLAANIKQAILDLHNPFLVLVDRDNTEELLAEQRRQMSGVYDDRYSAEAGRLLGARYVLTGKLLRFDDVLFKQCEVQMQLIDTGTGRIHASEVIKVNKFEITKGAPRSQLLEKASLRIAERVAEFDPQRK